MTMHVLVTISVLCSITLVVGKTYTQLTTCFLCCCIYFILSYLLWQIKYCTGDVYSIFKTTCIVWL